MRIFEYIDDQIEEFFSTHRRLGFYIGKVSNAAQTFRRVAIDAEWGPTLQQLRRISSPLLDVIPARGTRLAVLSQDGVPEFGAIIGQVWDEKTQTMTAWLRADLDKHPGFVELGAAKGVRIVAGDGSLVDITPTEDGQIIIEATGEVVVDAPRITLGAGAEELLARADRTEAELAELWSAMQTHIHEGVTTGLGVSGPPPEPLGTAGSVGTNRVYGD